MGPDHTKRRKRLAGHRAGARPAPDTGFAAQSACEDEQGRGTENRHRHVNPRVQRDHLPAESGQAREPDGEAGVRFRVNLEAELADVTPQLSSRSFEPNRLAAAGSGLEKYACTRSDNLGCGGTASVTQSPQAVALPMRRCTGGAMTFNTETGCAVDDQDAGIMGRTTNDRLVGTAYR